MPHAISFALASAFLALYLPVRRHDSDRLWLVWGLAGGLLVLVRTQAAVWFVLPATALFLSAAPAPRKLRKALLFLGAAALAFSPQMLVWQALYGAALTLPQGDAFLHWSQPLVFEVLFSERHGWLAWMPIAAIGIAGLARLRRVDGALLLALGAVLVLYVYVNSVVDDWWGGGAFGPRRFTDVLPAVLLGLAGSFDAAWGDRRLRTALALLCGCLIAFHWLFVVEYFGSSIAPDEPLAWVTALNLARNLPASHWLVLAGVPGLWHWGPFGTPTSTAVFLAALSVGGAGTLVMCRAASGIVWQSGRRLAFCGTLLAVLIVILDLIILRLA